MKRRLENLLEIVNQVVSNPRRLIFQAVSFALGGGLLTMAVSLGFTASNQVAKSFDALRATEAQIDGPGVDASTLPTDYRERLLGIEGVEDAVLLATYESGRISTSVWGTDPVSVSVVSVDAAGWETLGARVRGRFPVDMSGGPFAAVGEVTAERLGITDVDGYRSIWIEGVPVVVAAIIDDGGRERSLTETVVVEGDWIGTVIPQDTRRILMGVAPGAGEYVSGVAASVLVPFAPESVWVMAPPDPKRFRVEFESGVNSALLGFGMLSVVLGALVVAAASSMSVISRTSEFGLLRALGARGIDVFTQVLGEAVVVGLAGGVAGGSLGVLGTIWVAHARDWLPVIDPRTILVSTIGSAAVAAVAGIWPAIRAARIDPVRALRSG